MEKRKCELCGSNLPPQTIGNICRACRSICSCGNKKDYRAKECLACGMSRKAKVQWKKIRPKMEAGLRNAGVRRRHSFDSLDELSWQIKKDGRAYHYYYDESGQKRNIYRYQWVWIQARGPIPVGHIVHHINGDCTDDRLENLELMPNSQHAELHGRQNHERSQLSLPHWICRECGKDFQQYPRGKNGKRVYCSADCYHAAQRR